MEFRMGEGFRFGLLTRRVPETLRNSKFLEGRGI